MKHIYSLSIFSLCTMYSLSGMNFLSGIKEKVKEKVRNGVHNFKMNHNPEYAHMMNQCDSMRSMLFYQLEGKYEDQEAIELSQEEINSLLKAIELKNKKGTMYTQDLSSCLMHYNDLYKKMSEKNNIECINTIIPALFKGHAFEEHDNSFKDFYGSTSVMIHAMDNPYLMQSFFYIYNFPIKEHSHSSFILFHLDRIKLSVINKHHATGENAHAWTQTDYLKAIFAFPQSEVQKAYQEIFKKVLSLKLCFQKIKAENKLHHNLPKAVFNTHILPSIINDELAIHLPEEINKRAACRMQEAKEDIQFLQKIISKNSEKKSIIEKECLEFLECEFDSWAERNMLPAGVIHAMITQPKHKNK